ncbi:hypothetical protein BD779DRAFT_642472 [Infundibulicybe gibba]|nr:hypothetical protein BD779DRAFT_642472 [Infundibulicybe gibba]
MSSFIPLLKLLVIICSLQYISVEDCARFASQPSAGVLLSYRFALFHSSQCRSGAFPNVHWITRTALLSLSITLLASSTLKYRDAMANESGGSHIINYDTYIDSQPSRSITDQCHIPWGVIAVCLALPSKHPPSQRL